MRNKLEEIQLLMEQLKGFAPAYVQELGITHGVPNVMVSCLNPNHEDKNPSMGWYKEAKAYHCFSCDSTYDIFRIAQEYEHKPKYGKEFITETVFYLAEKFGLEFSHLDFELTEEDQKRLKYFDAFRVIENHVVKNQNQEYLEKRKIEKKTADELKIGSVDWPVLEAELNAIGITGQDIETMGIGKTKLNANKLIMMVKDNYGRSISFAAREMINVVTPELKAEKEALLLAAAEQGLEFKNDSERIDYLQSIKGVGFIKPFITPKYINAKASMIYNKSETFYGFSDIKKTLTRFKPIYIIEG